MDKSQYDFATQNERKDNCPLPVHELDKDVFELITREIFGDALVVDYAKAVESIGNYGLLDLYIWIG